MHITNLCHLKCTQKSEVWNHFFVQYEFVYRLACVPLTKPPDVLTRLLLASLLTCSSLLFVSSLCSCNNFAMFCSHMYTRRSRGGQTWLPKIGSVPATKSRRISFKVKWLFQLHHVIYVIHLFITSSFSAARNKLRRKKLLQVHVGRPV